MAEDKGGPDGGDHARDQNDHARDHLENDGAPGEPKSFANNYPDPLGEGMLQVWPPRASSEFDSLDDYFTWLEAFDRWRAGKPPPRPLPSPDDELPDVPVPRAAGASMARKSRHVGIRLTDADYELLGQLARAHSVALGTMAGMLVVRGVRAAADMN